MGIAETEGNSEGDDDGVPDGLLLGKALILGLDDRETDGDEEG